MPTPCQCGGKPHLNRDHPCGCNKHLKTKRAIKANLVAGARHETLDGRDMIVVPVVMIRGGVVMNEVLVPAEEVLPISWNGVPVTLYHPEVEDGYTSANSPDIIEKWAIGTIFNSKWDGDALKAEAWIDVAKANRLKPGLVKELEDGDAMDVSTGFFSNDQETEGESKGRIFKAIARNINPDHLALLPGGTGACSWEDGCGIRANERKDPKMADDAKDNGDDEKVSIGAFARLLKSLGFGTSLLSSEELKSNRRGDADDYRQVVADLISNDASPFVPQDEDSLRMMSYETLLSMRNSFLPDATKSKDKDDEEETPKANTKEADVADKKEGNAVTKEEVAEIVANALKAALPEALKANAAPTLSDEDKAALAAARGIVANARNAHIAKITANTKMTEEQLKSFSDAQLSDMAAGIEVPVADYSGRGFGANFNEAKDDDAALNAMTADHVGDVLKTLATSGKAN